MRRILAVMALLLAALAVGVPVRAQSSPASMLSRVGGVYFSPAYANWRSMVVQGNSATGAQTIVACPGQVTLNDGRVITPFSTIAPFTIDVGANSETLTPSAVSLVTPPQGASSSSGNCASITATFSNTHTGYSTPIASGDAGIEEAVYDASTSGGGLAYFEIDCGTTTLSTSGATTMLGCKIPASYITGGASVVVETTVTTAASYSVGTTSATTKFLSACTSLTAGQNCATFVTMGSNSAQAGYSLTAVLVTANATPGAGALHVKVWGWVPVQSAT